MRLGKFHFNKLKENHGFMLVDGLIAVLIVAIGLVSLAFMYTQGVKTRVSAERRQAAVQLAGQEMERLKKFEGGTKTALKEAVFKDEAEYLKPTVTGFGEYEIKSEVLETGEIVPSAAKTTQKIEVVRVTVKWNDPQDSEMVLEGYILVKK